MSAPQTNAIILGRPLSLFEAFLLSLASHAAILLILFFLGLFSTLSERPEPNPDRDLRVRFTVAPEPAQDEEGALPAEPLPDSEADAASPDPDAPASLDEPQPGRSAAPIVPVLQPETEADSARSDGVLEGVERGDTSELQVEADEPLDEPDPTEDTLSSGEAGAETELVLPDQTGFLTHFQE